MIEEIEYHGWKSLKLNAGQAELVIPLEIGPRVVACSVAGGPNLFHNIQEQLGGKGEEEWCLRGGHRLWHSPEALPRTYDVDNFPIKVTRLDGDKGVSLEAPEKDLAGIFKTIRIEIVSPTTFKLTHTIKNENCWPVECAPWALTVMERGGYSAIPLMPKGSHEEELLPNAAWVPWTYTDFSLPCWEFHQDFIGIETTESHVPQKLGLTNYPGWAAYWQEGGTFVKSAKIEAGATYPDMGCVYETFCNDFMIELETLGALKSLAEGESSEHVEYWGVLKDLPKPSSDAVYTETFKPAIEAWRSQC